MQYTAKKDLTTARGEKNLPVNKNEKFSIIFIY
jgi:hypothetical protein